MAEQVAGGDAARWRSRRTTALTLENKFMKIGIIKYAVMACISIIYGFPLLGQEIIPEYRYWSTYNERYEAQDVLTPFNGMPVGNSGEYFKGTYGIYYGELFPWIFLEAFGWCYQSPDKLDTIYITGKNLKINSPLEQEIKGWYRLQSVYLVVPKDYPQARAYWAQDLYPSGGGEPIKVNLGWISHNIAIE